MCFADSTLLSYQPNLSVTEEDVRRDIKIELSADSNWSKHTLVNGRKDGQLCDLDKFTPYGDEPRIRVFVR